MSPHRSQSDKGWIADQFLIPAQMYRVRFKSLRGATAPGSWEINDIGNLATATFQFTDLSHPKPGKIISFAFCDLLSIHFIGESEETSATGTFVGGLIGQAAGGGVGGAYGALEGGRISVAIFEIQFLDHSTAMISMNGKDAQYLFSEMEDLQGLANSTATEFSEKFKREDTATKQERELAKSKTKSDMASCGIGCLIIFVLLVLIGLLIELFKNLS